MSLHYGMPATATAKFSAIYRILKYFTSILCEPEILAVGIGFSYTA